MDNIFPVSGPWRRETAYAFMHETLIPLRLAVIGVDGCPLIASLWFLAQDDALWCATQDNAIIARHLGKNGRCGFELAGDEPPYRGIRGQGRATLHPEEGEPILRRLLDRYGIRPESRLARGLLAKADREVAIRIAPDWITSWDFRKRMAGAVKPEP